MTETVTPAGQGADSPGGVHVSGLLVCADLTEAAAVTRSLPAHIAATRSEPGCISFDASPTDDPLVWRVEERFVDDQAFAAHQQRTSASEWANATAGIERRFRIERG